MGQLPNPADELSRLLDEFERTVSVEGRALPRYLRNRVGFNLSGLRRPAGVEAGAPACEPLGVAAIHPDEFLLDLNDLGPIAVRATLEQQAADLNPPWPIDRLLPRSWSQAFPASSAPSARPDRERRLF